MLYSAALLRIKFGSFHHIPEETMSLKTSPPHCRSAFFSLLFFFFHFSFLATYCSGSDNPQYVNCSSRFVCGGTVNVTYPFWGEGRPSYCGVEGFELGCNNNVSAFLDFEGQRYSVLHIDEEDLKMTIYRTDLSYNVCSHSFQNTTILSHTNHFYQTSLVKNLNIFYGCLDPTSMPMRNKFFCPYDGDDGRNACFFVEDAFLREKQEEITRCNFSIKVPVLRSAIDDIEEEKLDLQGALNTGFEMKYNVSGSCIGCELSGGMCGTKPSLPDFVCYCRDKPHQLHCPTGPNSRLSLILPALLTPLVLAVIISILLVIRRGNLRRYSPTTSQIGEKSFDVENFINGITPSKYTYSKLKRMTNSFSIKLGQGGYGSVYKGSLKDGRPVAVKILSDSKGSSGEDFFNEVASISRTAHVNVVALLGFCYERKRRALVYEFMPNGSLDKFITTKGVSNRCSPLECKVLYQITLGIARGLEYLHRGCNTRIVHFDIKPHNILLDQDLVPKISDFGLAKLWQGKESMVSMQGARGTKGYIAPEVFCRNFGRASHKSDVYSYGMLVLDMVCGRYNSDVRVSHPSDAYFPDWIYREYLLLGKDITLNEITTEEEEEITRKMIIVSLWCIQNRPSDRPSIKEVIEMLEGSVQALQVPPLKPFQASPERLQEREKIYSTTSSSSFNGKEKISILEPDIRAVDSIGAGNNILAPLN